MAIFYPNIMCQYLQLYVMYKCVKVNLAVTLYILLYYQCLLYNTEYRIQYIIFPNSVEPAEIRGVLSVK